MIHIGMIATSWMLGVGGGLGIIVAIVAAVYLGPAVVLAVVQPIFARFIACTQCVVAVVFVLTTIAAYWLGHHEAANECRAAELSAELHNKQIDADIASETAKEARTAQSESEVRAAQSEQKVKEYADALKARPNAACLLTADDFPHGVRKRPGTKQPHAAAGK